MLDSSGLLGLLLSSSSLDFGRVHVRNVEVPWPGWLLGVLTPFCHPGFVVDMTKPFCIGVKSDLCHNPEMLDCVYVKAGVSRRCPLWDSALGGRKDLSFKRTLFEVFIHQRE